MLLSEGASLRAIADIEGMPAYQTVLRWLSEDKPDFRERYARARERQGDWYADRIIEISEEATKNPKDSNAYRVAGDLMKWACAVRRPHVYGERQQIQHSGGVAVSFTVAGLDDGEMAGPKQDVPVSD